MSSPIHDLCRLHRHLRAWHRLYLLARQPPCPDNANMMRLGAICRAVSIGCCPCLRCIGQWCCLAGCRRHRQDQMRTSLLPHLLLLPALLGLFSRLLRSLCLLGLLPAARATLLSQRWPPEEERCPPICCLDSVQGVSTQSGHALPLGCKCRRRPLTSAWPFPASPTLSGPSSPRRPAFFAPPAPLWLLPRCCETPADLLVATPPAMPLGWPAVTCHTCRWQRSQRVFHGVT